MQALTYLGPLRYDEDPIKLGDDTYLATFLSQIILMQAI